MITVWIADNQDKVKEMISQMLQKEGNINLYISKEANTIKLVEKEELRELVSLEEKIIEMEETLCHERKGRVYKTILEKIEKPLFEYILEYTEGNQIKGAKILGINRNTIRSKIKKLGIEVRKWKV